MASWLIVLNAEGTILAVACRAPPEWIGSRPEDSTDTNPELKRVTAAVRRQFTESSAHGGAVSATVMSTHGSVRVVVLEAIVVRRVATDIRELLESTVQVMGPQARAIEAALRHDVAPDVPRMVYLDPDRIAWTITTLVGNALRFVRRGTRLRPGGSITLRMRYLLDSSRVKLEVSDDGIGIPEDRLSKLLERAPDHPHASGLALHLVPDIMAAHGGSVEIESETQTDRSGTTIRLSFLHF